VGTFDDEDKLMKRGVRRSTTYGRHGRDGDRVGVEVNSSSRRPGNHGQGIILLYQIILLFMLQAYI
jgi:hypothetical protein